MRRAVHALATEAEWESVSPDRPCPVCGSSRGCSTHSSIFVSCERTTSQWPLTTGAWLHRITEERAPVLAAAAQANALRGLRTAAPPEPAARVPLSAGLSGTRA